MSIVDRDLNADALALPWPALPEGMTLMNALRNRASTRAFSNEAISAEQLSGLLWAANGVNRPATGGRTAPSAHNWQEIDLYVVLQQGSYRYDARQHRLLHLGAQDLRGATGLQDFVATAPLNLVYVADFDRVSAANGEDRSFLIGADAGCIAQNVYLYCAGAGLGCVVRGLVDRKLLAARLGLQPTQRIALAQSVGRPAD